jgi:hypothetical protein
VESGYRSRIARHQQAVIQAEMRRLSRGLAPYRLHRDAFRHITGVRRRRQDGFDAALRAALRSGSTKALSESFRTVRRRSRSLAQQRLRPG